MRELRLGGLGGQQPDSGAFLRAGLGQHEVAATLEAESERGLLRAVLARDQVPNAPGRHQVDQQDELPVLGGEQQPLGPPLRAREPPPLEGRQRRVERLQRGDVRRPGLLDRERAHRIVQGPPPGLHLGQLRHLRSVPWSRSA